MKNEISRIVGEHSDVLVGVGYGDCGIAHVGGVFGRAEYFVFGRALVQALKCVSNASPDVPIVVSSDTWHFISNFFDGYIFEPDLISINKVKGQGSRIKKNPLIARGTIDDQKIEKIMPVLKTYIPAAYRPYLKM